MSISDASYNKLTNATGWVTELHALHKQISYPVTIIFSWFDHINKL